MSAIRPQGKTSEGSSSPVSPSNPRPWMAGPYSSADLEYFAAFLAREMQADRAKAEAHDEVWYAEQVGDVLSGGQATVLRRETMLAWSRLAALAAAPETGVLRMPARPDAPGRPGSFPVPAAQQALLTLPDPTSPFYATARLTRDLAYAASGTVADQAGNRARRTALMSALPDRKDAGVVPYLHGIDAEQQEDDMHQHRMRKEWKRVDQFAAFVLGFMLLLIVLFVWMGRGH